MNGRPKGATIAFALAIVGGIATIGTMAWQFDANSGSVLPEVGLALLVTVLFFATAGMLNAKGTGSWSSALVISVLNAAMILCDILGNTLALGPGTALLLISLLVCALVALPTTSRWIAADRM